MFGWGKKDKKRLDELFGEFVPPELVEAMKSPDFNPALNTFREVNINYIFVAVDGSDPTEIGKNLGVIADITRTAGWFVDCMFSNLIVLGDGAPLPAPPQRVARSELVANLRREMGHKIKVLHGNRLAPWGSYGGAYRRSYGAMHRDLLDMLARLHAQPFGTDVEFAR